MTKQRKFNTESKTLHFQFDNATAANYFKVWLSEIGEQHYWDWMDARELEEPGNITALTFEYRSTKPEVIRAPCGRLDIDELDYMDPVY